MSTIADRYRRLAHRFTEMIDAVPADQWDAPSPCAGWSGRDVVGHVVAVQRWIEALARETEPFLDPYGDPGSIAGDDPVVVWAPARADVLDALNRPGVLARVVVTFRGHESIDAQIGWNVVDTLAHTWDLARTGRVDDGLAPELVEHALTEAAPVIEQLREPPFYAAPVPTSTDATRQEQLLGLLGRHGGVSEH